MAKILTDDIRNVALMGHGGCGKTTLFNILTGQMDYDDGSVFINPHKKLGLISQIPKFPAGYTVEDVLRSAFTAVTAAKRKMEELEKKMDALRNHHSQLTGVKTELDRENQQLQTNLLELLGQSLDELTMLMEEHNQELLRVRKQADTYRESMEACQQIRKEYSQWFGADRQLFHKNLEALDHRENTNLRQTFDIRCQDILVSRFQAAEQALEEVDRYLKQCADALRKDQRGIESRAGGR